MLGREEGRKEGRKEGRRGNARKRAAMHARCLNKSIKKFNRVVPTFALKIAAKEQAWEGARAERFPYAKFVKLWWKINVSYMREGVCRACRQDS